MYKPCPFCGFTTIHVEDDGGHWCTWAAFCTRCLASGPKKMTKQAAIDSWDRRDGDAEATN